MNGTELRPQQAAHWPLQPMNSLPRVQGGENMPARPDAVPDHAWRFEAVNTTSTNPQAHTEDAAEKHGRKVADVARLRTLCSKASWSGSSD